MRDGTDRRDEQSRVRIVTEPGTGRQWRVFRADTSQVPGAPTRECLIFDGSDVVRRVWRVPADWPELPSEELLELPWRMP